MLLESGKLDARTAERLALSLGEPKGIAMKVGQILSYVDIPLPEETRQVLAVLQVRSQPTPFEKIEQIVREDFGPRADALLSKMDRVPVSTASIGQGREGRERVNTPAPRSLEAAGSRCREVVGRHPSC